MSGTRPVAARFSRMRLRGFPLVMLASLALPLAGCDRRAAEPRPSEAAPEGTTSSPPSPEPSAAPASTAPTARLDMGAVEDRGDPDRLLRFYADALHARNWSAASRAWGAASGVTADTLKAAYERSEPPVLELGKGDVEGAAGSLYYEVPVALHFGPDAVPERGTLTLRRVNDVPGASPEDLRWHIERATIGAGE